MSVLGGKEVLMVVLFRWLALVVLVIVLLVTFFGKERWRHDRF